MDRDPTNFECTRDPIFLLQIGYEQWVEYPDGVDSDGESLWVDDPAFVADWVKPFIDDEGDLQTTEEFWKAAREQETGHGWPLLYTEWRTEGVFLTRAEAERWAKAHEYRCYPWKVYCIPCDGELAKILREYEPAETVTA